MYQSQVPLSSLSLLSFMFINAFLFVSAQDKLPFKAEAPDSCSFQRSASIEYISCLASSDGAYEFALLVDEDNTVNWLIFHVEDNQTFVNSVTSKNYKASDNSFLSLNFTSDGNLEMYIDNTQIWATNLTGKGGDTIALLDTGSTPELIIFDSKNNNVVWNTTAEIEGSSSNSAPEGLTPPDTTSKAPPRQRKPAPKSGKSVPAPKSGKNVPTPPVAPKKNGSSGKLGGLKLSAVGLSAVVCLFITLF